MSTRYVWDKYSLKNGWKQTSVTSLSVGGYPSAASEVTEVYDETTGDLKGVTLSGNIALMSGGDNIYQNPTTYPYVGLQSVDGFLYTNTVYAVADTAGTDWANYSGTVYMASMKIIDGRPDYTTHVPFFKREIVKGQGDYIGLASSSTSNRYPTNSGGGSKDGAWFIYKGSDNIDPYSVNYSSDELEAGKSITVTLDPRSNTYGGTVYYQYSYSTNGGTSWTNYGGKTTSTSQSITVPSNATQFRVRVQTSDDMGFTSTDYVTGTNLEVSQMKAYVGVNQTARKVDKMYVGVNGVARQVIKGYVGVNGIARKFL